MKRIVCFVLSACAFMFLQLFVFAENINIDYALESSLEYGADVQEPIEVHTSNVLEGEGTEESPYIISNLADFLFFGEKVNSAIQIIFRLAIFKQTISRFLTPD